MALGGMCLGGATCDVLVLTHTHLQHHYSSRSSRAVYSYLYFYFIFMVPVFSSPMVLPDDADIIAWTEQSLADSPVAQRLRPLFDVLQLVHLDKDDPARGDRIGKGPAGPDYVRALLAHRAAVVHAAGGEAAAAAAQAALHGFTVGNIVQYNNGSDWVNASISVIGDLAGTPIFTLQLNDNSLRLGINAAQLRALPRVRSIDLHE